MHLISNHGHLYHSPFCSQKYLYSIYYYTANAWIISTQSHTIHILTHTPGQVPPSPTLYYWTLDIVVVPTFHLEKLYLQARHYPYHPSAWGNTKLRPC